MKSNLFLLWMLSGILCTGCGQMNSDEAERAKAETPAPLKDETDASFIVKSDTKRFSDNSFVNDIYYDIAKKQPDLQKLETEMQLFDDAKIDSIEAFNRFNDKSDNYYSSAKSSLEAIKDTILRTRLLSLINASQAKYKNKTNQFTSLMEAVEKDKLVIDDYHETLKILVTLPIIARYQDKSMPRIKSIINLANEAAKLKIKQLA